VLETAERADGMPPVSDQALLAARHGQRRLFGVVGPAGALDGVAILGEAELDLVVRPEARGRGLGSAALAGLLEQHERDAAGAAGHELRAWAHGENPAATALLERAGFSPVRSLLRLALPVDRLSDAIAEARALPAGFRIAGFDPADDGQADSWVRVNAAAFADHPEQGSVTHGDFRALTAEPWFDPDDLRLAFDERSGSLAGYSWIKTVREAGAGTETELYVLGVDPAYAGRGLGAALLGETLRRMSEHSPDRISLYVDGDNDSARALYDRAGFAVDQRSTQWLLR